MSIDSVVLQGPTGRSGGIMPGRIKRRGLIQYCANKQLSSVTLSHACKDSIPFLKTAMRGNPARSYGEVYTPLNMDHMMVISRPYGPQVVGATGRVGPGPGSKANIIQESKKARKQSGELGPLHPRHQPRRTLYEAILYPFFKPHLGQ